MAGSFRKYLYRYSILGSNIDTYSQKELIDTLLYVPQKGFFFAGTIRENLMYGLSDKVSDKELIVALRSVCLYDSLVATVLDKNFVAADGIDKMVLDYAIGEGGTGMSGGEMCIRDRLNAGRSDSMIQW